MTTKIIAHCFFLITNIAIAQFPKITNQVPSLSEYSGEIVAQVKLAKEYSDLQIYNELIELIIKIQQS